MEDCLFCKIAAGEIPSTCLYQDEDVFVFEDINPQASVHYLVIPRVHIPAVSAITAENADLTAKCFTVISRLTAQDERLKDGFRVVSNCGPAAGQTVPHLHFHVLGGERLADRMV